MLEGVNALFYTSDLSSSECVIEGQEVKHITKVLRKQEGDSIFLTDGKGNVAQATIRQIGKQELELDTKEITKVPRPEPQVTLAFSVLKQPSRMEWMIEKATEYGVSAFQPVLSAHCIRSHFNPKRLESVALSAMKQSLQCYCPEIYPIQSFDSFVKDNSDSIRLMAYTTELIKTFQSTWPALSGAKKITAIVGPEGGFSKEEARLASASGFSWVSLGPNRLRAESASLAIIQQINVFSKL